MVFKNYLEVFSRSKVNNFKNLDELIHNDVKKIVLDSDFVFNNEKEYLDGIKLDMDNLIIDANNHSTDGANAARIFEVCTKNILIKNAVLKNANIEGDGGAINNLEDGKLRINNVEFIDNCSKYGSTISNEDQIEIEDASFINNSAISGGVIVNAFELIIKRSTFKGNDAANAGAIDNWKSMQINDTSFSKNSAIDGRSIVNDGKMNLDDVVFEKNSAERCGAINNQQNTHYKLKKIKNC